MMIETGKTNAGLKNDNEHENSNFDFDLEGSNSSPDYYKFPNLHVCEIALRDAMTTIWLDCDKSY